jgi:hypothetical protein
MKRINLAMTKCTNPKCKFRVISEATMRKCPICHSKTMKDKDFRAQGLLDTEEGCIILKEKGQDKKNNR